MRLRTDSLRAAWAGPRAGVAPPCRSSAALPDPVRLVDLAPQLVQPLLDRGSSRPAPAGVADVVAPVDLLPELMEALVDGVVLGIGRTHRAVSDRRRVTGGPVVARVPEMDPDWAAGTTREPSEHHVRQAVTACTPRSGPPAGGSPGCNRGVSRSPEGRASPGSRWKDVGGPMAATSAGLLLYRIPLRRGRGPDRPPGRAVLGPEGRRAPGRSPRASTSTGRTPLDAAYREFEEEVGLTVPAGEPVFLGERRQPGGKRVSVWALRETSM